MFDFVKKVAKTILPQELQDSLSEISGDKKMLAAAALGPMIAISPFITLSLLLFISPNVLKQETKRHYPNAFAIMIKKKKKDAVNVGIFDEEDNVIAPNVEFKSKVGISKSLYVGQKIYLHS